MIFILCFIRINEFLKQATVLFVSMLIDGYHAKKTELCPQIDHDYHCLIFFPNLHTCVTLHRT